MALCLFLYFTYFLLLVLNFLVHISCWLNWKRDTFMVRFEKYLAINYIFYVFILQKGMLFSQSLRIKFQKCSAQTMVGPP